MTMGCCRFGTRHSRWMYSKRASTAPASWSSSMMRVRPGLPSIPIKAAHPWPDLPTGWQSKKPQSASAWSLKSTRPSGPDTWPTGRKRSSVLPNGKGLIESISTFGWIGTPLTTVCGVAMPVPDTGKHFYGIPYGTLERQPYLPEFHWYAANGDWPAVNWAGVETHGFSLALLNKGLPSYRIEPGKDRGEVILLSVLRSPAIPTYLHEPNYYTMTEWDGMRDAGEHTFEFAVAAYPSVFADSRVVLDAESYSAGLVPLYGEIQPPELPELTSLNCRLAMVKWAEKDRAIVLRVVEFRGKGGEARLTLPDGVQAVDQINLLEREARPLVVENSAVVLSLRPWEIASLRLMLK